MTRKLSPSQREEAFLESARQIYGKFETWYGRQPDASFGEIEAEVRKWRRELMGQGLGILVNGRDTGFQEGEVHCKQCGQAMDFEGYHEWSVHGLEGDTVLERAYYVCPQCKGETIFPLG